ncbi:MAG: hypothetical protein JW797_10395 [Bradymonadales bacterium]|nr:hypothetical protein [Bradymonadales bacterium]
MIRTSHVIAAVLLLAGCTEDRPQGYEQPLSVVGPVETATGFAFLHRTFQELMLITPSYVAGELDFQTDRIPVGRQPLSLVLTPDLEVGLVINAGDQTLSIIDLVGLKVVEQELPSDYDSLTVSPDSRFVVAHYRDAQSGGSGEFVFRNQNEITVFDLYPGGRTEGERLSEIESRVLSLRSSPLGFDFIPPFTIQGQTHHLLVVRAESALTLVDMTAESPVDLQRRLFFVPETSERTLLPLRILSTQDDPADELDMRLFVLTSGSQDIFEISILPPLEGDDQALNLSINQFPGGPSPVEMISYIDRRDEQKLLVLNGATRELVVVDVQTGNTTDLDIDWTVTHAVQYLLPDPDTGVEQQWALLYTPSTYTVLYVNLSTIEDRGSRAIIPRTLSRPIQSIHLVPAGGATKAIVVHSGSTALSVLDLAHHFDIPLPGSATLSNIAFSASGDYLFTTVAEVAVLVLIELENGHPTQINLPEAGGRLAVLTYPQVILVDHMAEEGRVTLLNGVEPDENTRLTINGLFLEELFAQAGRGL